MPIKSMSWENTILWAHLKKRASRSKNSGTAKAIVTRLEDWMPQIEIVLTQGHTDPLDFTLHDSDHSYRVAQRMMELVKTSQIKNISDYEIAFLLLSAYLHDIGMSPERKKVKSIYNFVLLGQQDLLTVNEVNELQAWLDENRYELDLSHARPDVSNDTLELATEITTYYVRHKHNDWSAEWIDQNLNGELPYLSRWKDLLILLCQSHHFGHQRLRAVDFDPFAVGCQPRQRVHLRYLACLLRLADILENDPERVPRIIFRHRDIASRPKSLVHWQTPHQLTISINANAVRISARPLEARFEKAIRLTADAIDVELAGCAAIAENNAFSFCPGLSEIERFWIVGPACIREIRAHNNTYDYIDGAFRPNTEKLLELLSGEQLYQSKFDSIRELLQNAFDAVREKIAYSRLLQDDPSDEKWDQIYGDIENVTLTLYQDLDGTLILRCKDTGCGMTKEIIEKYLLVSGEARRPAIIELERRCNAANFTLNRTGQFGIGVLSYFMMAKEVRLVTCRMQESGDNDGPGWTFETTGVGDFGELRRLQSQPASGSGSIIEWILPNSSFPDTDILADEIERYIRKILIKIPCRFCFQTEFKKTKQVRLKMESGWTHSISDVRNSVISYWEEWEAEISVSEITTSSRLEIENLHWLNERLPNWMLEARKYLKFATKELILPDKSGVARVILPWFDLPEGPSLCYIAKDSEDSGRIHEDYAYISPSSCQITSWKGIRLHVNNEFLWSLSSSAHNTSSGGALGWISCDFYGGSDSILHVSRGTLVVNNKLAVRCKELLRQSILDLANQVLPDNKKPLYYGAVSDTMLCRQAEIGPGVGWFQNEGGRAIFSVCKQPFTFTALDKEYKRMIWDGNLVHLMIEPRLNRIRRSSLSCGLCPDRIVALFEGRYSASKLRPVSLYLSPPRPWIIGGGVLFPPEWSNVWGCDLGAGQLVFNASHLVMKVLSANQRCEITSSFQIRKFDWPLGRSLSQPNEALVIIMKCMVAWDCERITNFIANKPHEFSEVWQQCAHVLNASPESLQLIFCPISAHWVCLNSKGANRVIFPKFEKEFNYIIVKSPGWSVEIFE